MKKIAIIFSLITIFICGWLIIDKLDSLDIASNKNDTYANIQKQEIDKRTDINSCQKKIEKNKIDNKRQNFRNASEVAYQTQVILFIIIVIQIVIITCLFIDNSKSKKGKIA